VRRAVRAGARGYFLKDAAGEDLLEAIRSLAAGQRYFSAAIEDIIQDLQ
jgi:DNA-binding NarL/FixJ family response regulator